MFETKGNEMVAAVGVESSGSTPYSAPEALARARAVLDRHGARVRSTDRDLVATGGSRAARTDFDLEAAAERLREERDEVRARLASMTKDLGSLFAASVDSNADDEHDPEGQTIAYERSQLSAFIQGAQQHLSDIEAATTRMRQGSYGICEVCDQPILAARLEARPTARTCVRHAAARG